MIKLIDILGEIKNISKMKLKVIAQDNDRKDLMCLKFPGGETEWFYFGGYYYALCRHFNIHSTDENEIQEYKDLFDKYHFPYFKDISDKNDFDFPSSIVEFEPHIEKFSPWESKIVNSGKYKDEQIDEIKNLNTGNVKNNSDLKYLLNLNPSIKIIFIDAVLKDMGKLDNLETEDEGWNNVREGWFENEVDFGENSFTGENENILILDDGDDNLIIFSFDKKDLDEMFEKDPIYKKCHPITFLNLTIYYYFI